MRNEEGGEGLLLPPSLSQGIRQSHMSLAHRCMRQLWFYLYEGPSRPNYFKALGSAGHRAIEFNFREKLEHGNDPNPTTVTDLFVSEFDVLVQDCEKTRTDPLRLRDKVAGRHGTLPLFLEHAKFIQPKRIEQRFELELEEIPVPISGTVDLLTDKGELFDWKFRSGNRLPSQKEVEKSFQLHTYTLAMEALDEPVKEAVEAQLVCNPEKPAAVKYIRFDPAESKLDFDSVIDEYRGIVKTIAIAKGDPDLYPMTDPANWWCDEVWCGWSHKCPRFGGKHQRERATPVLPTDQ